MSGSVRLWIREDGEQPKCIPGDGTMPPGPGVLVDVMARSAREARAVLERAEAPDIDEEKDGQAWQEQRAARRRVKRVARLALVDGKLARVDLPALHDRLVLINKQAKEPAPAEYLDRAAIGEDGGVA